MSTPLISVLMPAYNASKFIDYAIGSILDQSVENFEFIILDDCSTDDTLNKVKGWSMKDCRIKVLHNDKNLGIVKSRNILIDNSLSEYIAWQDSDDFSIKNRLEKQLSIFKSNSKIAIVGGNLEIFNDFGILGYRKFKEKHEDIIRDLFLFSVVSQPAAMYKKSVVIEVGKYDEDIKTAEDLNLTFKIAKKYKLHNIPEVMIRYRVHGNNETIKNMRKMEFVTLKIRFENLFSGLFSTTPRDYIYNFCHLISMFLIPSRLKFIAFNKFRNE